MNATLLMTAIAALFTLAGVACAGVADDADLADTQDPAEGRLVVGIVNGEFKECVYDALVTLEPGGVVDEVSSVGTDAEGEIEPGMVVEGAAAVFPNGAGIPVPVHLDDEGVLRGSYALCLSPLVGETPGSY